MNRLQRNQIKQTYSNFLITLERKYVTKVYKALLQQVELVSADLQTFGPQFAASRVRNGFDEAMTTVIRQMHLTAGVYWARRTYGDLNRQKSHGSFQVKRTIGTNPDWVELIKAFFDAYLLESVRGISETTRQHIIDVLKQGTEQGLSTEELVKLVNDKVYLKSRAAAIVRTESSRASNYGVQQGGMNYRYQTKKEWVSITDNRTRHSHLLVDQQTREMGERFSNGLLFPGDPAGEAKEVVNCRCTMAIVPKRDRNGDLIPKRTTVIQPGNFVRQPQTITI